MGIAAGVDRIAVGGKGQIWSLREHSEPAAALAPVGRYDRCWLLRSSSVTGGIQCHEIAWGCTDKSPPVNRSHMAGGSFWINDPPGSSSPAAVVMN